MLAENHCDHALFTMAIDRKQRSSSQAKLEVADEMSSGQIKEWASVLQSKTQKPVRFEISKGTHLRREVDGGCTDDRFRLSVAGTLS